MIPSRSSHAAPRIGRISLLFSTFLISAFPQTLNTNLVVNGGAESGPAAGNATDPQVSSIPGWTPSGGFSVGTYDGGNFLSASSYGPMSRGKKMFYGGPGNKRSTGVQTIDLTAASANIDAGIVKFYLSGYLGLLSGSYDNINTISLKAEFQDTAGNVLLTSVAPGPSPADVNFDAGLLLRTSSGFVPANVRKVRLTVDLSTSSNGYNAYAADNISLLLTTDPVFSVNLMQNGDAETDPQNPDGYPVPGWNADSFFLVGQYGAYKMPTKTDNGPADRGKYFFSCPSNHSQCRAYQNVDFSRVGKMVDAGKVSYTLSGWFGGDVSYPDNADATVTFYDASGAAIGAAVRVGPVLNADRSGQRGLWQRSTTAAVPNGARSAQVNLFFHKLGPVTDNLDAFADDLQFQLDAIQVTSVVNAASSTPGPVAPGEFVTIYGSSLGPAAYVVAAGSQKGLAGTHVTFNGIEAYLTVSLSTQVNAIVPYGVGAKADVVVTYNGQTSDPFALATTDSAPGIFTQAYGPGQAWAVNNDGNFNAAKTPVTRGGWISFWGTGQGLVTPAGQDGEAILVPKNIVLPVKVSIGGIDAQILGAVLLYTGEVQVNVVIPGNAPTGDVPLVLTIGTNSSRKDATIAVK